MIEKIVLDYLNDQLTEPVYMENPNPIPSTDYVLIEKTGSSERNQLKHATLAVQSISSSLYGAAQLNEKVKTSMKNILSLSTISRAALETDYNYTNTATKQYRYQAVFDFTYMEVNNG